MIELNRAMDSNDQPERLRDETAETASMLIAMAATPASSFPGETRRSR